MEKYGKILLRLPNKVIEAAKRVAEVNRRTVTAQLNLWIEQGMPKELLDVTKADISTALLGGDK